MTRLRPQYHLRPTPQGIDAWDVRRLVRLSEHLPVRMIDPSSIAELHENHWYFHGSAVATPASIIGHLRLIEACDVSYPIILDASGRVMDGMHRVCRAVLDGIAEIPAVQFVVDPDPDFVGCDPALLPYEQQPT